MKYIEQTMIKKPKTQQQPEKLLMQEKCIKNVHDRRKINWVKPKAH